MMLKNPILVFSAFGCILMSSSGWAQPTINSVRVYTDPPGVDFTVDGQGFYSVGDFPWPANSKHVVSSSDQVWTQYGSRFIYKGWVSNLSPNTVSMAQPITADPGLRWVKLVFDTDYLLTIAPGSAGTVTVNGDRYLEPVRTYVRKDTEIEARAYPADGYIFTGWAQVNGPTGRPTAFIIHFVMSEPSLLAPQFYTANALHADVNIQTDPKELQLILDQTPYTAPITLQWGWGTVHSLGALPVQNDHGTLYVFDSWSDGGAINHTVQVPTNSGSLTYIAKFVRGTWVQFATSPSGLNLSVDGRQNWLNYDFVWAPGTTHKIAAPSTQTDAQGLKYRFVSWSNGRSAAYDYTVTETNDGPITAVYQLVGQATFNSIPSGMSLDVDGSTCTTPCTVEKDVGATLAVSAPALQTVGDGGRLVFRGWADTAETSRRITLSADPKRYTANYASQHHLSVSVVPAEGATVTVSPYSPDGFYDDGSVVSISAELALGFKTISWTGDLSSTSPTGALTVDGSKSATLMLDRVPAIAPAGIRNAATSASPDRVAPGSLISIFGANLAPGPRVGPSDPLAQTLNGVTVRVEDMFLPLVFVSPAQINAQLPSSLSEGTHEITVRWEGKPEVTVPVSVVRNAPGLFEGGRSGQPIGAFVRADGRAVTQDDPAHPNDVVSLYGTGFGPCVPPPPDGFVLSESASYHLIDAVTVKIGEGVDIDPLYSGRSAAGAGVDAVRFQIPMDLSKEPLVPVKIRIGGKESNTVLLPVRR